MRSTCSTLILLPYSKRELNTRDWELEMNRPLKNPVVGELVMENKGMPVGTTQGIHTWRKLSISYGGSTKSYCKKSVNAALLNRQALVMTQQQEEEKGSPTEGRESINPSYPATPLRSPLKPRRSTKIVRRPETLAIFQKDLNFAEQEIHRAASAPQGFPESKWKHIFKGEAVNLDVIFSNLHHIAPPKENVGCIRRTEISLGKADPARKVQMSGDWTVAWHATSKVTVFAFPH